MKTTVQELSGDARFVPHAIVVAMLVVLGGLGSAQSIIWQLDGVPSLGTYPYAAPLQDINGDGITDLLVWPSLTGHHLIHSGRNGHILRDPSGTIPAQFSVVAGTLGDVDRDGAGDYMVFSTLFGMLDSIISGATGTIIGTVPWYGTNGVSGIGDVNGDGFGDFAIGILGMVEVYAGPTGTFLYRTFGPNPSDAFGTTIVPLGDVNNDGVPDFLVGAPGLPLFLSNNVPGWTYVVSGANGAIIRTWTGPLVRSLFGKELVSPGNIDGDGVPDVLVGAPGPTAQQARLFSGATGVQLGAMQGSLSCCGAFASELAAPGDVDVDGVPDYAIHDSVMGFELRSGATGNIIYTVHANQLLQFAYMMGSLGNVNGDGFPDIFSASLPPSASSTGVLAVYSLLPQGLSPFGAGCTTTQGALPRIGGSSVPRVGQPFTVNLSQVAPSRESYFCAGFSNASWGSEPLPWNLTASGATGCDLLVSLDRIECVQTFSRGANGGAAALTFQIPAGTGLVGLDVFAQWFVANPPGSASPLASTRGLRIQVQP